jgi:glutathione synthase/RimK-type ligase-like ATP-grasp enzyme
MIPTRGVTSIAFRRSGRPKPHPGFGVSDGCQTASVESPCVEEVRTVGPWASRWLAQTERLRAIDAQLERDGDAEVALWFERARLLEMLGLREDAKRAYFDVLARDRSHCEAMMSLGQLLAATGDAKTARIFFAEAALRYPHNAAAQVRLGEAMLQDDELATASACFEDALRLDPDLREAHRGLATSLERSGDREAAERAWRKAFPDGSIEISPYRGATQPVRVLLLTSATGGNIPIKHLLDDRVFEVATLIAESYPGATALPPHGVVLNAIGEADRCERALAIVEGALGRGEAAIVNHPTAVRATGRVANAQRLAAIPGVVTPSIVRITRRELIAPDGAALLAALDFDWPVLLRSPGFHTGEHFALVEHAARLRQIAESLPGPDLLAISYIDTRHADGSWRKYRVMFVDGRPYPLHLAISTHWKVHYFSAAMADRADYREEERAFLEDMPAVLGAGVMEALRRIAAALELDYGGVDFALDPEGRVVVFEANATMVITPVDDDERWTYRRAALDRVADAVRLMLVERARA